MVYFIKAVPRIYLDHQASTPVDPGVLAAMEPFFREKFGSPSSFHQDGLTARDAMARAREQVAGLINAESPEQIIFTSSGTEAANLAVKGVAYAGSRRGRHIVVAETEHPAVLRSGEFLARQGFDVTTVKVNREGFVDPEAVRAALTAQTILICVHHANHDIGTIQPIAEIARVAAERGIVFFADATASGGWLSIDVQALGVNLLSLAPHRFYGPKGVGILYRSRAARLESLVHGGSQEDGKRAGTENVPAIVGAGAAAALASRQITARQTHTGALQKKLWEGLAKAVPYLRLNGPLPGPGRSPVNLNLSVEFIEGEGLVLLLDMQGVAVTSGPSCASKAISIPPILTAIGLDPALARGNILFSLGEENTGEEIDRVLQILPPAVARLRSMSPLWDEFQRGEIDSLIAPRTAEPAIFPN